MKLSILSVALFVLFIRCSKSSAEENLIEKYYNNDEIEQLELISEFVIEQMSKGCEVKSQECLYRFFDKYEEVIRSAGDVELGFSQSFQKELLNTLDKDFFNDIWYICEVEKRISSNERILVKELCIKTTGRFSKFLADFTSENEKLKGYGETLQLAGGYSPSMTATLIMEPERFNFQSKEEMLIVAIHLFTLNYSEHVKMISVPNKIKKQKGLLRAEVTFLLFARFTTSRN